MKTKGVSKKVISICISIMLICSTFLGNAEAILAASTLTSIINEKADGFASVNALGQNGTTGGAGGTVVHVSTQSELEQYVAAEGAYIIIIDNDIDLLDANETTSGTSIKVTASNKTIIGAGDGITLRYGGLEVKGQPENRVYNVIIRNVKTCDTYVEGDWDGKTKPWDGMQIQYAHHVWIDHCEFSHHADALLDVVKDSNYVTVSWCKFSNHNKTFAIGTSNVDTDQTKITIHHNQFENVNQRNPRVNNGLVHVYNNYYLDIGAQGGYISSVEKYGELYFEGNYIDNSNSTLKKGLLLGDTTASIYEENNTWKDCSDITMQTGGYKQVFNPTTYYTYVVEDSNQIPTIVKNGSGIGKLNLRDSSSNIAPDELGDCMIVAKDGSGDFNTVQAAVDFIAQNNPKNKIIYVRNGVYEEKVRIKTSNITIVGEDVNNTVITIYDHVDENQTSEYNNETPTMIIDAEDFTAVNLTVQNTAGQVERANAVKVCKDRASFYGCKIISGQDTLFVYKTGRAYFYKCYIEGDVDFIYGGMIAVFEGCEIFSNDPGYVTAASTPQEQAYGYLFKNCNFTGSAGVGTVYLGRPWRPYASVVVVNSNLGSHIKSEGWHNWGNTDNEATARYMEYNNSGAGWEPASRVEWAQILNASQAAEHTPANYINGTDSWKPYNSSYMNMVDPSIGVPGDDSDSDNSNDNASTDSIIDEAIYMIQNVNSGLYLDVTDGKAENATNVQQWAATAPAYYNTWKIVSDEDGYYKIYSQVGDGKTYLLDVANGSSSSGTNIQIYQDTYSDAQLFKFVDNGDGTYGILSKCTSGKSGLDVAEGSKDNGANVQQWSYNAGAHQRWILEKVSLSSSDNEPMSGVAYMIQNVNSDLYLDVTNGIAANGTNVQQWGASGAASYNSWKLEDQGNGYYKIYSLVGDGTYLLDVTNNSTANGTNIQIWQDTYCDAQLFKFADNGDGTYGILTKTTEDKSGLDVIDGSRDNGGNVQQWGYTAGTHQLWRLIQVQ